MDGEGHAEDATPGLPSRERPEHLKVALVGGGLGGLMAARTLARWGSR